MQKCLTSKKNLGNFAGPCFQKHQTVWHTGWVVYDPKTILKFDVNKALTIFSKTETVTEKCQNHEMWRVKTNSNLDI